MIIRLSYNLTEDFPPRASTNPNRLILEQVDYIGKDSKLNNRFSIQMTTHIGTHIDAPYHFNDKGKRIVDFSIEDYVFDRPLVLEVHKNDEEFIYPADLIPFAEKIEKCDLLMLRTGFSKYRFSDPLRYSRKNPGISKEAAQYLMEKFPSIRAVAIDTISIEFEGNYDHGFQAHKIFLGDNSHLIFLIEDVNLNFNFFGLVRVIALPLFIEKVDGCPCTILAELRR